MTLSLSTRCEINLADESKYMIHTTSFLSRRLMCIAYFRSLDPILIAPCVKRKPSDLISQGKINWALQ